jgi:hypothetical protein
MHLKPTAGFKISTLMFENALKSVKHLGNTVNLIPKWARTLLSLIYFSWDIYRDLLHIFQVHSRVSNINFDI